MREGKEAEPIVVVVLGFVVLGNGAESLGL
jgi:hypothetical protein